MKNYKSIIIGTIGVVSTSVLPIVPQSMTWEYAFQYPVQQTITIPATSTSTESTIVQAVNSQLGFVDEDNNGIISVAVFKDSNGNEIYVKIPDSQYAKMGEKEGSQYNPKKESYISILEALTPKAKAASPTYDTTNSAKTASQTTSLTFSHTMASGSGGMLIVGAVGANVSADPTGVTYNGVSMNLAISGSNSGGARRASLWYLANPTTGANNVVVTWGSANWFEAGSTSFTGADSTIGTTGTNFANTGSPVTVSVTTVSNNSYLVDAVYQNNNGLSLTVNGSQIQRWTQASADGEAGYGSTLLTTTAGSYTMSWTQGSGAADGWVTSTVEVKGAAAATASFSFWPFFTF